jgi:hypothetical protein
MDNARDFVARLASLLRDERSSMAEFLLALADFDRRRLWVAIGHSSLFYFLHRELGLSAGAAYHRKVAAELLQRFPDLAEPLRDGRLCITSVCELAKVLTPENRAEVLPRFFHASKQQAKAVAAEISPREAAAHRTVVTSLPANSPSVSRPRPSLAPSPLASAAPSSPALDFGQSFHPGETPLESAAAMATPTSARPHRLPARSGPSTDVEPLSADARRLHVTVSKRFLEKLDAAKDALSHSHPGAEAEAILEAGLDLLIERAAKRRGIVEKPRAIADDARPSGDSRHIPAAVRREVWVRDGGCCQWPTAGGERCGSRHRVQFDHVVPVARGGRSTTGNLRLLCAFHNDLAAREVFGDEWMDSFSGRGRRKSADARAGSLVGNAPPARPRHPLRAL